MNEHISKKLGHGDESGFYFAQEMLGDNVTAAVNFDRLQKHPELGYIIMEYLLCEETQRVTPFSSHPNRYWDKNRNKFLSLWRAKLDLNARLYLVNYAKKGTKSENEVLLIEVLDMNENGITKEIKKQFTREHFKDWFAELNNECLDDTDALLYDIYFHKSLGELANYTLDYGKHNGKSLGWIKTNDKSYLEWIVSSKAKHYSIVKCYLDRLGSGGSK